MDRADDSTRPDRWDGLRGTFFEDDGDGDGDGDSDGDGEGDMRLLSAATEFTESDSLDSPRPPSESRELRDERRCERLLPWRELC